MKTIALAFAVLCGFVVAAQAKSADCFSTDDGEYPCRFVATDGAGSFEISARGKPTYSLIVDSPGVASGFVNFGDRNVSLPGTFYRAEDDPACWDNDTTDVRICAW